MDRLLQRILFPDTGLFHGWAVLLCLVLAAGCGDRSAGEAVPPRRLELIRGSAVTGEMAGGEHRSYQLSAGNDQVVELSAEARGLDLVLMVSGPGDEPCAIMDRGSGGQGEERLSLALRGGAVYVLAVHARAVPEGPGGYTLRVEEVRRAAPADWQRAAADRSFASAETLRAHGDREHGRQAVEGYREALARLDGLGDRWREAEIYHRLGLVHRKILEEKRRALEYYERALALFEGMEETPSPWSSASLSGILNNLGRLHFDLGETEQARERWQQALELNRRTGDRGGEAAALGNLALASRYLGEAQEALVFYDHSLAIFEEIGARVELGRSFNNRGRFYLGFGQPRQALADLERALEIGAGLGDLRMQAMALTGIGQIREQEGDLEPALEVLRRALRLRQKVEEERGRAVTLRSLGRVYAKLGDRQAALEADTEALAIFRRLEARRETAGALAALGRLANARGEPGEALGLYTEALGVFRELRDTAGEIDTLLGMARAERARGELRSALRWTEEALQGIEGLRGRTASHDLRRSLLARHQDHYGLRVDLLMELHRREPDAGYDRRALEASERSRARSLVELLTESREVLRADADPKLLARKRELESRLGFLEEQRLELLDRGAPGERTAELEARLDALLRELRAVRGRIRAASPRYAALLEPRILSAEEIQTQVLDPDTLLLHYHLGAEGSYLWVVSPSSAAVFGLPPREEIEDAARRAHELLRISQRRRLRAACDAALAELGRLLLAPVADRLGDKRLLIAGDGALHYVPFAALPVPRGGTPPAAAGPAPAVPLVSRHEVVTVPSASALEALRAHHAGRPPPPGLLAVVADPVFAADDPRLGGRSAAGRGSGARGGGSLQRLPFSGEEAGAILRLAAEAPGPGATYQALGLEATREAAISPELGRYRIVHFATHGHVDTRRPELSRLVFSRFDAQGRPREGSVYAHEIFNLDLPVDLVVLSGCETALGREIRGEGLVGLSQGFLHAGAAAVVMSLWQADDRATAELMARFYRELLRGGRSPAAALRQAQVGLRGETGWRAPYFWAGFVLQGEPGPAAARRGDPSDETGDETDD